MECDGRDDVDRIQMTRNGHMIGIYVSYVQRRKDEFIYGKRIERVEIVTQGPWIIQLRDGGRPMETFSSTFLEMVSGARPRFRKHFGNNPSATSEHIRAPHFCDIIHTSETFLSGSSGTYSGELSLCHRKCIGNTPFCFVSKVVGASGSVTAGGLRKHLLLRFWKWFREHVLPHFRKFFWKHSFRACGDVFGHIFRVIRLTSDAMTSHFIGKVAGDISLSVTYSDIAICTFGQSRR
jgi:hypothetical protein